MRNYGTNVYSNNFEPQVNGVLDARTKIEGPASDLILDSTWTSKDGKQWACAGLVVAVTNDPDDNKNGLYLLLDDDYSLTSNWKFIGSDVDLSSKQDVLVSGQNIKTINGNSILGPGNLEIQGGGSAVTVDDALSTTSTNPVQNKVVTEKINTKQDTLVSGTSIKTVNNVSLLGSGNIDIPKGDKGDTGATGTDGITPTIGDNGNWFLGSTDTGKPSRGEKGDNADNKVYVTTFNFRNAIDGNRSVTPEEQDELNNIVNKYASQYVVLYRLYSDLDSIVSWGVVRATTNYEGISYFYIEDDYSRYRITYEQDSYTLLVNKLDDIYKTSLTFKDINNNDEYTAQQKQEVSNIISEANKGKIILYRQTYINSYGVLSGELKVAYTGNEEITFSIAQPNGDTKYYSPNGSNSGTYWKVWTVEGKPTIVTLNTTGMLKRGRTSTLTLNSSDVNKLVQLVNNKSNYANCIITYCGVEDTSSSNWQERVILNHTGNIYPPMDDEETNYDFWLSFISGNEARVFYFDISLTIPVDGSSPTAVASIIKEKKFGSDTTIKQLTTDSLFKYGRGEVISMSSEDKEILVSLFNSGYKKTALFYTYDGNIGGGNSYSAAVNVSGLLSSSFTGAGSKDLTLTVAAEGMVYKEILTYNTLLSTWTTKQDPVVCTEEIEADVKNNGYWWDKKTGFVQQWGRVAAKAEGTTITLAKPMQFTLSATATPGTNSNNIILQIFSTSGTQLVVKPDTDCTVYWHVIGYATE